MYVLGIVLGLSSCIRYAEFDGHEYVYTQTGHGVSTVHSPNCKCLNEHKKTDFEYKKTEVKYKKTDDGRNVEVVDSDVFYNMRYIEFDGHEYVFYRSNRGRKGSMCHSPKCKCLNEYKK